MKKNIMTLKSIQNIASESEDAQLVVFKNAIIDGMRAIEGDKEPRPKIVFKENPPFIYPPYTESTIVFSVELPTPGAAEAKNVDVWFLISPEIEIMESSNYKTPFQQDPSYVIPSANTTRYPFNLVKRYVKSSGKVKIKTTAPGEYKLRYKADCENHAEAATTEKEITIIVKSK
jgi:hypothetical protein